MTITESSEISGFIDSPGQTATFIEDHIQGPVARVLHIPVFTDAARYLLRPKGRLLIKYRRAVVLSPAVSFVDVRYTTQMLFNLFHSLNAGVHFTSSDCQQLRTAIRPCPFSVLLQMGAAMSASWSGKRLTALLGSG